MSTVNSSIPADSITNNECYSGMALERSKLATETKKFNILPQHCRVFDSFGTVIPTTAASDDLGMIIGTLGTDAVVIQTSDAKASTTTQKTRFHTFVPHNYVTGGAISACAYAGMKTTVSDTTATIDFSAYRKDADTGLVEADSVSTSATTINSLTEAAKVFTITPTNYVAGDEIDVLVTVAITDGATATAVIGRIMKLYMQFDVKG